MQYDVIEVFENGQTVNWAHHVDELGVVHAVAGALVVRRDDRGPGRILPGTIEIRPVQ
jgi:hypothetical protein